MSAGNNADIGHTTILASENGSLLDPFKGHRPHGWQLSRICKRRINHGFDTPLEIATAVDRPTFVKSDSFVRG